MTDTTNCELCGRGMARKALTPTWWQYDTVCDRANCRAAARDAMVAVERDRERNDGLIQAMQERHETNVLPVGWRSDAHCKIDVVDNEDWWANNVVKTVGAPPL